MEPSPLHVAFITALHRMKAINLASLFDGLSRGEYFLLEVLKKHKSAHPDLPGIYALHLAQSLRVSPPAVSRMLRSLESRALVERDVDRNNRRNTFIRLTVEGERLCETARKRFEAFNCRVFDTLGEKDARTLIALLGRLVDAMEAELNTWNEGENACSKSSNT